MGVISPLTHGGGCRTVRAVRAQCAHGSMFLEYAPSFYPVEQPPQNHTQGPNFCTLLAYQEFLFFVLMLVTGPRVLISAPCSSC